ncbi:MAG: bifunctional diaminohydroxyphosphoribosylaminopyrimidine deaminase/5-amino-6-(5-phosphoribosylamino)uracil reductase RibD [Pseudomonas sp.]|jgi:diaminohydroxyphosphoribosylaminopyrimidine deaminase/5-amino-6-(5-phosphoribosylamino)uracil reductase|nr:bifunctional diaminohydroxyphosphoribosylaminopyrimidine deaminase/5-amino-6-(5-phosphoribosylamino)uracil reductase RibD [Pseudomonas sp.]MDD2223956.1 bifunctional diaminohydroxyphosphoribosylaminopyrimidine deaminase/5-amino-6-(5-phosphoribosylamino)uracil reductase RibD [Pseudomonas sp.]MDY0415467.1 bifunctional diaminohydroxyphosphoribosylaminopyrimidine deaminase/5-amino-6-(5-phosphoribosylamino)uracil reductase RibD [Pseudomonas sp.]NLO54116.1 bifunctional diaminohydroxyphosphoribosylam
MNDQVYMAQALRLAEQGLYSTHPNPRVGCVVVADGQVVGEGWHVRAGEPHAEVHALRQAAGRAQGATAYVTLEPCSHHGLTPPCAEALVHAGVQRVVIAMQDPNPQVAGRGIAHLRAQGIQVDVLSGELSAAARGLNCGFVKRMEHGLPFVRLKLAMSLDGRTAMASGESQWITGPAARADVQSLRARSSAIITGAETVMTDNARLTVRAEQLPLSPELCELALSRPPLRIVIDGRLRVPTDLAFFTAGPVLVVTYQTPPENTAVIEYIQVPELNGHVDLSVLLGRLAQRGINELMVEAGPQLAGAFIQAGLVDELYIYMAAMLLGSSAQPLMQLPIELMADAVRLQILDMRALANDWRIIARPLAADV